MPSYENIDMRVDWKNILGNTVDAAFFMTNVTDNTHIVGGFPIYAQLGFTSLVYNEPRMFGFSLKYRFGGPSEPEATPEAYREKARARVFDAPPCRAQIALAHGLLYARDLARGYFLDRTHRMHPAVCAPVSVLAWCSAFRTRLPGRRSRCSRPILGQYCLPGGRHMPW